MGWTNENVYWKNVLNNLYQDYLEDPLAIPKIWNKKMFIHLKKKLYKTQKLKALP